MDVPLWTPSAEMVEHAKMTAFRHAVEQRWGVDLPDYPALYSWSVENLPQFWTSVWTHCGIIASRQADRVLEFGDRMPGAKWFGGAKLNFAENLLRRRDETTAIVSWGENGVRRSLTYGQLFAEVARLSRALRSDGVGPGDRVAGYLPNVPEAVIAMLATVSIGAVWSSCSPDFGIQGVLDRFGQINPKILFAADGYSYNGKEFDSLENVSAIGARLPNLARIVIVDYVHPRPDLAKLKNSVAFDAYVAGHPSSEIEFAQLPFDHPLYVLYSSGTTGAPKCIIHGAGGTLIQHLKEHQLHTDLSVGDGLFYFTTCGWMMWNWLVSGLASGAKIVLYEGSPIYPKPDVLFDMAEQERISVFGTSPKFLSATAKAGLCPRDTHDLSAMKTILSTGSPLPPELFDFVYAKISETVRLSSIAGGTDIISCFALGNPLVPVWRGELQSRGLGMKMEVFDGDGRPLRGEKGELVCTRPFPSMPIGFWGDHDDAKYRDTYFSRNPGVWHHGDYVELTAHDGVIFHGRSDAILNPGGVRIGTAEIYRQVESIDEVLESIVIGQDWENDCRVVLFVKLREGVALDDTLVAKIKRQIRQNTTPRHVPAKVLQVSDIPRTLSGKIVELAVRDTIHGRTVKNKDALANPEALELFKDLAALKS